MVHYYLRSFKAEHDKTIWVVGREQPAKYDGIVTNQAGVTVCAAGADCCMILLADTLTGWDCSVSLFLIVKVIWVIFIP